MYLNIFSLRRLQLCWLVAYSIVIGYTVGLAKAEDQKRPLGFSELPVERRREIERQIEPPPLAERDAPYSTPMYYLMRKGYYDGINNEILLDRNRPDWQEVLIRDWAELGLTSTLACTSPKEWDDPDTAQAYRDYFRLSKQYGMDVGMRLSGDETLVGIEAEGWGIHPRNPENRLEEYAKWAGRVAKNGRGAIEYYILGDEVNGQGWEASDGKGGTVRKHTADEQRWTPEDYMVAFTKIAEEIRKNDPDAKVCMFGMNGIDLPYVDKLIELGYTEVGDGVAANVDFGRHSRGEIEKFVSHVRAKAPNFKFYSNGVGYIAARDTNFNPINHGYEPLYNDIDQANCIARGMIQGYLADWDVAPYYITLRQWLLPDGKAAPHWYGFFGIQDLKVDEHDHINVVRHPGWYALQTVAHVFYDRDRTPDASIEIGPVEKVDYSRAMIRNDYECLLALWNNGDSPETTTDIRLDSNNYTYPVQVPILNYRLATDLPYKIDSDGGLVIQNVKLKPGEPVIIRLVKEKQAWTE